MAKTTAERQAAYRARRPQAGANGNGERRLSMWIDTGAFFAVERLARRYGVTKRELIERMVVQEDDRIISSIGLDTTKWDEYFGNSKVTQ